MDLKSKAKIKAARLALYLAAVPVAEQEALNVPLRNIINGDLWLGNFTDTDKAIKSARYEVKRQAAAVVADKMVRALKPTKPLTNSQARALFIDLRTWLGMGYEIDKLEVERTHSWATVSYTIKRHNKPTIYDDFRCYNLGIRGGTY